MSAIEHRCPVDNCTWLRTVPDGQAEIEDIRAQWALVKHVDTHTPSDWLRTINRLKRELLAALSAGTNTEPGR